MLLVRNESDHQETWSSEKHVQFVKKCMEYIDRLTSAGKLIAAQPLVREGAIISVLNGAWQETPFNKSGEVQVGYYHIRAKDLAEAVEIAKANPEFEYSATAKVEVRPVKMKEESTAFVYPK